MNIREMIPSNLSGRILEVTAIVLGGLLLHPQCAYSQMLVETENVLIKQESISVREYTSHSAIAVAHAFLESTSRRSFVYLKASNFAPGGAQMMASPFKKPSFDRFIAEFKTMSGSDGCQLEVLGINSNIGLRWICASGSSGESIIQGLNPFEILGGSMFYVAILPGDSPRLPVFEAYLLSASPNVNTARTAINLLRSIDRSINWRIVVAPHAWLFEDAYYSPYNPNLLRYSVPRLPPEQGAARVRAYFDARTDRIDAWE